MKTITRAGVVAMLSLIAFGSSSLAASISAEAAAEKASIKQDLASLQDYMSHHYNLIGAGAKEPDPIMVSGQRVSLYQAADCIDSLEARLAADPQGPSPAQRIDALTAKEVMPLFR